MSEWYNIFCKKIKNKINKSKKFISKNTENKRYIENSLHIIDDT